MQKIPLHLRDLPLVEECWDEEAGGVRETKKSLERGLVAVLETRNEMSLDQ